MTEHQRIDGIAGFRVESMPFDIGFYRERPSGIPERLPFQLTIDADTGLIRQIVGSEQREALRRYYEIGGYASTPLGEGNYGKTQGDYMLAALERAFRLVGRTIGDSTFIEIGASYGYLLHELATRGAKDVVGIEPGEEGANGSAKYGIRMIKDFFPTPLTKDERFDVVLSHCMLEHVEDPLAKLKEMRDVAKENGMVFLAVPDAAPKMSIGDLSIVSHQHINYFTRTSLRRLLVAAGFSDVRTMTSTRRAILFGWGVRRRESGSSSESFVEDPIALFTSFSKNFAANVDAIQRLVVEHEEKGHSIGLYAPDANLAGAIRYRTPPRMFNKDSMKLGTRNVESTGVFESPDSLASDPPDAILIAPVDYDVEISRELSGMGVATESLISLRSLYEKESAVTYPIAGASSGDEEFVS